jgi:hypothetical protein
MVFSGTVIVTVIALNIGTEIALNIGAVIALNIGTVIALNIGTVIALNIDSMNIGTVIVRLNHDEHCYLVLKFGI